MTNRINNYITNFHFDRNTLFLIMIIAIALVIRLTGLTQDSMHIDEIWGANFVSERSAIEVIHDKVTDFQDAHPVLYYSLLDVWAGVFGCTAFACRMLSVVLGIISVILIYKLSFLIFKCRTTALLTAALIAIAPLHVKYSQTTRMYIFLMVTWTACLHFLILTQLPYLNILLPPRGIVHHS